MAAEQIDQDVMFGVLPSTRHTQERLCPDKKALKKDLRDNRKGQDQESKITSLYNHLFDDVPKGRMQFPYHPILLLIYYAITAIVLFLLWASLVIINRELSIGLSPKFIYELLMAVTSFDLRPVDPFIKLTFEIANAHSSEEGLNVSLQGMLRQLFRISGINFEDAMTHGTLPADFDEMVGVLFSRICKVLDDNPDQVDLIRNYLKSVLQDNDHMFGHTDQGEPNAPETQHRTLDRDPPVTISPENMDLDDSDSERERGDVGMNNEMETSPPTAPDMRNDSLPNESQGRSRLNDNNDDIEQLLHGWEDGNLEEALNELMRFCEHN
ncbi:hypothetical protein CFIMG_006394RAa [Ceratocystis fimbriata CBS 114723]|uniref:Uncharacterized protein n=1 Tax=Ceratocystis fimbriata CBS 114723 TaxID=1035309 RepID=A0A2C5WUN7_9PEZI|nr:hypothetical protein CFIMG_006394RAa [Ceratocystis fimbriata CBS 114723]